MSHQEKIQRMNAELNTPDTWAQRWQIEREHNERLLKQASMARDGVHQLRARAIERYTQNHRYTPVDKLIDRGALRALDDVLQLFDQIEHFE